MRIFFRARPVIALTAAFAIGQSGAAFAAGEAPLAAPRLSAANPMPAGTLAATPESQGNIAELTQMLRNTALTEMRTTYHGSYGASLFLDPLEMTYYVALFQHKNFWRVITSEDRGRADAVYANFVDQAMQLAASELAKIELDGQKHSLKRAIAQSEQKANRLRVDLDIAKTQRIQVAERQKAIRKQTRALESEKQAAQIQLNDLQQQVRQLQYEAENDLLDIQ